jgi:iron(II)-dependent oxidoreductase
MSSAAAPLSEWIRDARRRTLALVEDLSDGQLMGPRLDIVNPLLWELGHLGWFQERWVLCEAAGRAPLRAGVDALYDSSAVPHDVRWDLPLPSRAETLAYLSAVEEQVQERLATPGLGERDAYFATLAVFHEDMHGEAFAYTRQTLGYPAPRFAAAGAPAPGGALRGDVEVPGGRLSIGARPADGFVFDNEKWAHEVELRPFRIARAPVTQGDFRAFVEEDGYRRRDLWTEEGWAWRERHGALHPVYWRREADGWLRREFDRWVPLEPDLPALHVCWHEAQAWCRFAGRRLPTEAEWEAAASHDGAASGPGRTYPWGEEPPDASQAALDFRSPRCAPVSAHARGDGALGCRQMIGNVWEWTESDFLPYPGFVPDPYREYSQPWFGTHKVLRGGCHVTRSRLLRNTCRNFYTPDRRDVWAGFRTCAP